MVKYNNSKELFEDPIKWENWNRIVERTKQDIAKALENFTSYTDKYYGYNEDGDIIHTWEKQIDVINTLDGCPSTISNYIKKEKIYNSVLLSAKKYSKDEASKLYTDRLQRGLVYLSGKNSLIYTYNSDGVVNGLFEGCNNWAKHFGKTYNGQLKDHDIISDGRLVSKNYYDVQTAKKLYNIMLTA